MNDIDTRYVPLPIVLRVLWRMRRQRRIAILAALKDLKEAR